MTVVPVLAIYKGIDESDLRFLLSGGILLALFLPTCWMYWIGSRLSHSFAAYAAGVGIFGTLLYSIREGGGTAFLFMVPFGIAEYLLYRLHQKGAPKKEEKTESAQVTVGFWLKENVEAIVIAFVMALVIRCFFIEVFKIPSSSMEPTLLGDAHQGCAFRHNHGKWAEGDRIMVMKYNYLFEDIQRYDVVVFKFPLELSRNFIKRVVGLPNEEGFIHGGNWFVRKAGGEESRYQFARKPVRTQKSIWIEPASSGSWFQNREKFLHHWWTDSKTPFEVSEGALITYEKKIRFHLEDRLKDTAERYVGDVMIGFHITPSPGSTTQAYIGNELGEFTLTIGENGSEILYRQGPEEKSLSLPKATVPPGKSSQVQFSVFDGQALLILNDQVFAPLIAKTYYTDRFPTPPAEGASLSFETSGKSVLRDLRVGRDLYYHGRPEGNFVDGRDGVVKTGPDDYIMFGDNVTNSHDSRLWKKYTYHLKDGSLVICEGAADKSGLGDEDTHARVAFQERHGLGEPPDYYISADWRGHERAFQEEDLDPGHAAPVEENFITVTRKHIVGKAFWVWWPPGRWFHMIR